LLALQGLQERQVGGGRARLAWIARLAGLADRLKSKTGKGKQDWMESMTSLLGEEKQD